MPNYSSTGGHAMATTCSHCGTFGAHKASKTAPRPMHHSNQATMELLVRIGTEMLYRRRTRECCECHQEFSTAEIDEPFLLRMTDALLADRKTITSLQAAKKALEEHVAKLLEKQDDVAARAMNALAELRDPTISRHAIGVVPVTTGRGHAAETSPEQLQ